MLLRLHWEWLSLTRHHNCVSKKNTPSNIKIVSQCQTHHHSLFVFFFPTCLFVSTEGKPNTKPAIILKNRAQSYLDETSSLQSLQFVRRVGADTAAHTLCNLEPMLTLLAESIMFSFHTGRDRCSFINVCTTRLPRPWAAELGQRRASRLISLAAFSGSQRCPRRNEGGCVCCCPAESAEHCRLISQDFR